MNHNLSYNVLTTRILNAQDAGSDNKECTEIDTLGFEAVRFIVLLGGIEARSKTALKIEGSNSKNNYAEDHGGITIKTSEEVTPTTHNHKMIISDIYRPQKRFLKATVLRSTANAAINGVIAELYRPTHAPVSQDTTVAVLGIQNSAT